ncbi:zinc ion binding protein [Striga asiatica]|uniref:Zinc ion binding protein n=1 Tax=Striga asiatica TaxID=4170 RepID=A0A5A7QB14_STRAF|nr:zinc ion binding protein [Striga asiatica]
MARWDEILSLPVQSPPTLEFGATDLVWSRVEGWRDNIDRLALIPFARVDDFVRGESNNKECPTRFHVEARRRRPPKMPFKPKVDGILEYILYWCSFGPDDHRKGGIVRPSRTTYVPKKKPAGRPNTKRGCTCHFIVKRLIADPSVALVIYNQDKHVDKKGLPCHGPLDEKAAGTRAMYAPYISEELRLRVLSLLHVGVSVETIMQRHNESVEKQGGPCNRDDLLTHRYVRRQERSIRRSSYELDEDDEYPVHSLVVFNSDNKAIPVAWVITTRFASRDTHRWMRALYNRVCAKDPTWKLAGFVVDEPSADILAIREVFECSVLICFWRVRHSWHKNLMKRVSDAEKRAEIAKQLGDAVQTTCKGAGTANAFEDFIVEFVDAAEFMDYFKAIWYPRIGTWTRALKTLPFASQETCAAMEFYHKQLKIRLTNEKDKSVYRRADWLVNKLFNKVHSYFWLDEYSQKEDYERYRKDEWMSGPTAWGKSLTIPDSCVTMESKYAKVTTEQNQENTVHLVRNPGSEYAICDCEWSENGNLCEHVFKVIKFCRENRFSSPSLSMFQYGQSLINMLHSTPFDSLVRDHAVTLAVWVQTQLKRPISGENGNALGDDAHEPSVDNQFIAKRKRADCEEAEDNNDHRCVEIPGADVEVDSSSTNENISATDDQLKNREKGECETDGGKN